MKTTLIQNKNKIILGSAALAAMGASGQALAATVGLPLQAQVAAPVNVLTVAALNFGSLTESGAGTLQVVHNSATAVTSANVSSIGSVTAGTIRITGNAASAVKVEFPASVTLSGTGGGTMSATGFTVAGNAVPYTDASLAAGDETYNVGATLNVGAAQTQGAYTGSATVTVNYN